jgi:uncharacterized protein (TIGR02145 family)
MKIITTFLLVVFLSAGLNLLAQVAVNDDGSGPDSSAMLDVNSLNRGFLFPRLTTVQISGMENPANGLMVYNTDSSDFFGFNGSKWIAIWNNGDTLADWYCGNPITYEGKSYGTVQIGDKCWLAENLNVGSAIKGEGNQANNLVIEKYCFDDDESNCDTYGGLYQWKEMMKYQEGVSNQGICPLGWHLPTDAEWQALKDHLSLFGANTEGGQMKETGTSHWDSPNTSASNSSGFTGLGAGYRTDNEELIFTELKLSGRFWSISSAPIAANTYYYWKLYYNDGNFNKFSYNEEGGFSVRCIKNN